MTTRLNNFYNTKNFQNTILICAVLVLVASPLPSYALKKKIKPSPSVNQAHVRLGIVTDVLLGDMTITFVIGTSSYVTHFASTTKIYTGNNELIPLEAITRGSSIYVFGTIKDKEIIDVQKIVIKNKSKLARKEVTSPATAYVTELFDMRLPLLSFVGRGENGDPNIFMISRAYASQ